MTTEAVTAFVERLKSDEAFRAKLMEAASREERRGIAREAGYELSEGDLPALKVALGIEELSDDDLERVAGGMGVATTVYAGATGAGASAMVATLAALAAV